MARRRQQKLGIAVWLFACFLVAHAVADSREPVAVFSGTGNQETDSFEVKDGWVVEWSTENAGAEILLLGTESDVPSLTANPPEPATGQRTYARGGTYRFQVQSDGRWRLEVFNQYGW